VREMLGSGGRGDPREGREEQRPASGPDERGNGECHREQRCPHADPVPGGERVRAMRRSPRHLGSARLHVSRAALFLFAGRKERLV